MPFYCNTCPYCTVMGSISNSQTVVLQDLHNMPSTCICAGVPLRGSCPGIPQMEMFFSVLWGTAWTRWISSRAGAWPWHLRTAKMSPCWHWRRQFSGWWMMFEHFSEWLWFCLAIAFNVCPCQILYISLYNISMFCVNCLCCLFQWHFWTKI